jgi:hypothetical protein
MTLWSPDLLEILEQIAARRAQKAHREMAEAVASAIQNGMITDSDASSIDMARARYDRENRRHELWLDRRLELWRRSLKKRR